MTDEFLDAIDTVNPTEDQLKMLSSMGLTEKDHNGKTVISQAGLQIISEAKARIQTKKTRKKKTSYKFR